MNDVGKQLDPGRYHVVIDGQCNRCGGPRVATFEVTSNGFLCGDGFKHTSTCSSFTCKHGIAWDEPCERCDKKDIDK